MRLTPDESKRLNLWFQDTFDPGSLAQMLRFECDKDLANVSTGANFLEVVFGMIQRAENEGWVLKLIEGARKHRPNDAALETLAEAIAARFQVNKNRLAGFTPFKSHLIRQMPFMPFVNRHTLRTQLEALQSNLGSKVLVIDGPPGSGKSYSKDFILYLSDMLESFKVVYIDLKEDYFPGYTPGDLISDMARMMSFDLSTLPQKEAQDPRWSRELCTWLIGKLNAQPDTWWLVIDSVAQIDISQELSELIKRLAMQVENQTVPLRIVLIDYGQMNVLPVNIQDKILSEQITLLQRQDVAEFFKQLLASKGVTATLDADALDALAEWVFTSLEQLAKARQNQQQNANNIQNNAQNKRLNGLPKVLAEAAARLLANEGGGQ